MSFLNDPYYKKAFDFSLTLPRGVPSTTRKHRLSSSSGLRDVRQGGGVSDRPSEGRARTRPFALQGQLSILMWAAPIARMPTPVF